MIQGVTKHQRDLLALQEEIHELTRHVHLSETLLDASIDLMFAIDTRLRITAWNKTCVSVFGLSREEVLGKNFYDIFPRAKDFPKIGDAIASALKGLKAFVPATKGSYQPGYFENHFIPFFDEEGTVTGVLNLGHDVAHRVKTERQLIHLNKTLTQRNKELRLRHAELSTFCNVTSNDLKEPLRKIKVFVNLFRKEEEDRLSGRARYLFQRIWGNVGHMEMLTDDILTFSRLEAGNDFLGRINLNHTLKVVLRDLEPMIANSRAVIETSTLPVISGYRNMMVTLFRNILVNALKFQPAGNIPKVSISSTQLKGPETGIAEALPETDYVRIGFTDNGMGFDNQYSDYIFLMFSRLEDSIAYPGNGLGLTICKKITDLNDGFIRAESQPGQGSTFYCFFPQIR